MASQEDDEIIDPFDALEFVKHHVEHDGKKFKLFGLDKDNETCFAGLMYADTGEKISSFDSIEMVDGDNVYFGFICLKAHNEVVAAVFSQTKKGNSKY